MHEMARRRKNIGMQKRLRLPYWGVVRCVRGHERFTKLNIEERGNRAFIPYIKRTRSPKLEPLFPGYVFVLFDQQWTHIRYSPGVIEIVMNRGRAAKCQFEEIEELIAAQGVDGFIDLSPTDFNPKPGDQIKISQGLFKDHLASYIARTPEDRIRALISNFLGKPIEIIIERREARAPDPT
jgi:transcription antitermination factor NusG